MKGMPVFLISPVFVLQWLLLTVCLKRDGCQISRLLVLEPAARLTAEQALAHPFFRLYQKEDVRLFSPRKTFRVICSRGFTLIIYHLHTLRANK